jgi:adenine-specific DNA-methyltransferase
MGDRGKLELTWVDKYKETKVEPRLLIEDKSKSYGDPDSENMLIHGDNLLALKALEQDFAGKIKCVYIDPPYNTGNAFEHYDDGIEHSLWLSLIKERLKILHKLLSDQGSMWISIDDDECHYLKILCDEVFGRNNYITSIVWQKIHSIKNDAKYISVNHDYILIYAKKVDEIKFNLLDRTTDMNNRYKNPDNDQRGPWQSGDLVANEIRANGSYDVIGPTGKIFNVPNGKHWVYSKENMLKLIEENRIWFGKDGTSFPRKKRFLSDVQQGRTPDTWWTSDEVGHNQEGKREVKALNPYDIFPTPKPERLIERIINIATNKGDIVLDSFAGSGTTGAVAHKLGRKWINIELGEHCNTHILPRLKNVVDGSDEGGITKSVSWLGGGGFKFYKLADSLLIKDEKLGTYIINPSYPDEMIIKAICKIESYKYNPQGNIHGFSTEKRFIHVTKSFVNQKYIEMLANEISEDESLLVFCIRRQSEIMIPDNIEIKRIPQDLIGKFDIEGEV